MWSRKRRAPTNWCFIFSVSSRGVPARLTISFARISRKAIQVGGDGDEFTHWSGSNFACGSVPARGSVSGVQASGRLSTPAKLYLHLVSVTVKGKAYTFATSYAGKTEKGKGKRDAGFIGGGAAGGAAIGALAGGGKGAE